MDECLSVKPKTDPTITRPSTSTPRLRTYKPKKKTTKPTPITSRILTSNSSQSNGNEAQNSDENTNRMEIDPSPGSQPDNTPAPSHEHNKQSVGSNNLTGDKANDHQNSPTSGTNPAQEQNTCRNSARLANITNPESSPNPPPTPLNQTGRKRRQSQQSPDHSDSPSQHCASSPLSSVPSNAETDEEDGQQPNNPEAENHSLQPDHSTNIPNNNSHDSTQDKPAQPILSDPERSTENFTIITNQQLSQIITGLANTFRKGRVSKPKWHQGCHSFEYLLKIRLDTPEVFRPPATAFIHNTAEFNYDNWTKEIAESS